MDIYKPKIKDLIVISPDVFKDDRGYFFECFSKSKYSVIGIDLSFVQDNESYSRKNVIRGLHFQCNPYAQGKLIRVIKGSILDIAVDIRKASPTFGNYFSIELNDINKKQLWIPPGFAHGYAVLSNEVILTYKCTAYYNPSSEITIIWNDPDIGIEWGINNPIISEKDKKGKRLKDIKIVF
ncbi:dTDP-4-dehydrorhamnose 3,5-epimerase [candidate division WOR-3 bacterium]|jgi:dTDP-4-dehydrorhamnose 3,5-epimerase|nr:dTDP-4-dehydrorhamnose 3,5-epimerase [candidate division WOR-3 bacterium]